MCVSARAFVKANLGARACEKEVKIIWKSCRKTLYVTTRFSPGLKPVLESYKRKGCTHSHALDP